MREWWKLHRSMGAKKYTRGNAFHVCARVHCHDSYTTRFWKTIPSRGQTMRSITCESDVATIVRYWKSYSSMFGVPLIPSCCDHSKMIVHEKRYEPTEKLPAIFKNSLCIEPNEIMHEMSRWPRWWNILTKIRSNARSHLTWNRKFHRNKLQLLSDGNPYNFIS